VISTSSPDFTQFPDGACPPLLICRGSIPEWPKSSKTNHNFLTVQISGGFRTQALMPIQDLWFHCYHRPSGGTIGFDPWGWHPLITCTTCTTIQISMIRPLLNRWA
jgi:hypothetical protein